MGHRGVLIPFLAGLLFGRVGPGVSGPAPVLIPFLAGLLFGPGGFSGPRRQVGLNPLFGGSAFRTMPSRRPLTTIAS